MEHLEPIVENIRVRVHIHASKTKLSLVVTSNKFRPSVSVPNLAVLRYRFYRSSELKTRTVSYIKTKTFNKS
jgi:hypothetical protein